MLKNVNSILVKLQTNPKYAELLTTHTALRDTSLTKNISGYDTEDVEYSNYSNFNDSNSEYRGIMTILANRLVDKYKAFASEAVIRNIFEKAKEMALDAMCSNKDDMPCGCGKGSGAYDDYTGFTGNDDRADDKHRANMATIVEVTLYYFDKLFYKEVFGS